MSKFTLNKTKAVKAVTPARFNPRYALVGLVMFALGAYIWQTNNLVSFGYQVKELESKTASLKDNHKDLENKVVQLRSVQAIQDKIDRLSLVPAGQIEYINPVSNVIAQK